MCIHQGDARIHLNVRVRYYDNELILNGYFLQNPLLK